jgi:hypothetical protein
MHNHGDNVQKANLISYEKMVNSKLYSGFETHANHMFVIKYVWLSRKNGRVSYPE